jgi:hypothetical protein
MGSIHNDLHAIFDDERRAVTTPGTVLGAVAARVGRRRAGRLVGASAGTLAVAGLAAVIPLGLWNSGPSSVAPGAPGAATPTNPAAMPPNALGLSCGEPLPASLLSSPERSEIVVYQTDVTTHPTLGVIVVTSPLPSPVGLASLYVSYDARLSGLIIGRDDKVAGWTDATPPLDAHVSISWIDQPSSGSPVDMSVGRIVWCPNARSETGSDAIPASGSYLTYPIVDPNAR